MRPADRSPLSPAGLRSVSGDLDSGQGTGIVMPSAHSFTPVAGIIVNSLFLGIPVKIQQKFEFDWEQSNSRERCDLADSRSNTSSDLHDDRLD